MQITTSLMQCVSFSTKKLRLFWDIYKKGRIRKGYPGLDKFLEKLDKSNLSITESRRNRENRNKIYKDLEENYIPYLLGEYEKLQVAEKMAEVRESRQRWFIAASIVIGAVGLIGSLASIWSFFSSCSEFEAIVKYLLFDPPNVVCSIK